MATTTVYLTLEPMWSRYDNQKVAGMKVKAMTKTRPTHATGPVVKLTLQVPDQAFLPLAPEVVIEVPPEALDFEPTVVVDFRPS